MTKPKTATFPRDLALAVANKTVNSSSIDEFLLYLDTELIPKLPKKQSQKSWRNRFERFSTELKSDRLPYSVFMLKGNTKLPFAAFSTLPIVTCPGIGECRSWCYSLTAWRYADPYLRQLQNTLLIKHRKDLITKAVKNLPHEITVRLYVDGDIDSIQTLNYWMNICKSRSDLSVYGYSKSWELFLKYSETKEFPSNYVLNLSGGSRYDSDHKTIEAMKKLSCVRGLFVAVNTKTKIKSSTERYSSPEYHKEVRETARKEHGKKVISCPGFCGSCGKGKHFCGNSDLKDVVIAIGVH